MGCTAGHEAELPTTGLCVSCFMAGARGAHKGQGGTAESRHPRMVKLHMATAGSTQALSAEPWVSFVPLSVCSCMTTRPHHLRISLPVSE